nr:MAG TPA: hypothetical protein [Bacteriophage sp.]
MNGVPSVVILRILLYILFVQFLCDFGLFGLLLFPSESISSFLKDSNLFSGVYSSPSFFIQIYSS